MSESAKKDCEDYLGLTALCQSEGAHVVFGYKPNSEQQFLTCGQNSRPETFIEQFADLSQRLEKIVTDAFVAVYPIDGPVVEGYACLDGALFACATLAVDVVHQVPELKNVSPEALDLGGAAADCVDGDDFQACMRLGEQAADAAGVPVGGVANGADNLNACTGGDIVACTQLGQSLAAVPR